MHVAASVAVSSSSSAFLHFSWGVELNDCLLLSFLLACNCRLLSSSSSFAQNSFHSCCVSHGTSCIALHCASSSYRVLYLSLRITHNQSTVRTVNECTIEAEWRAFFPPVISFTNSELRFFARICFRARVCVCVWFCNYNHNGAFVYDGGSSNFGRRPVSKQGRPKHKKHNNSNKWRKPQQNLNNSEKESKNNKRRRFKRRTSEQKNKEVQNKRIFECDWQTDGRTGIQTAFVSDVFPPLLACSH